MVCVVQIIALALTYVLHLAYSSYGHDLQRQGRARAQVQEEDRYGTLLDTVHTSATEVCSKLLEGR